MSLTNQDAYRLKQNLDKHQMEIVPSQTDTSFFMREDMLRRVPSLQMFDYDNASDIVQAISNLYRAFGENCDDELMKITEISLLKNKDARSQKETISTFVYEF